MEYAVVHASVLVKLVAEVNEKLSEGWLPQGGVLAVAMGNGYFQAMTREKTKNENTSNVAVFTVQAIN